MTVDARSGEATGSRLMELGGLSVRLRGAVSADAAVVLVHGVMDSAASFGRCMRRLAPAAGPGEPLCIAVDRRGYANSLQAGVADSIAGSAADLRAVIRGAAAMEGFGAKPVLIVGHSLGGTIAMEAARSAIPGAELVAVASYESPRPWVRGLDGGEGLDTIAIGEAQGPEAAAEHFFKAMVGLDSWNRLGESGRRLRRAQGPALMADLTAVRRPGYSVRATDLVVPIACAMGSQTSERIRAATIDLAREAGIRPTEIQGAGHGAHLTRPGRFAEWIRAIMGTAMPASSRDN